MPNIQVKNVPDDVHRILRARAADLGQSLQEYLLGKLIDLARKPTVKEVLARGTWRSSGLRRSGEEIAALIREDRDSR